MSFISHNALLSVEHSIYSLNKISKFVVKNFKIRNNSKAIWERMWEKERQTETEKKKEWERGMEWTKYDNYHVRYKIDASMNLRSEYMANKTIRNKHSISISS